MIVMAIMQLMMILMVEMGLVKPVYKANAVQEIAVTGHWYRVTEAVSYRNALQQDVRKVEFANTCLGVLRYKSHRNQKSNSLLWSKNETVSSHSYVIGIGSQRLSLYCRNAFQHIFQNIFCVILFVDQKISLGQILDRLPYDLLRGILNVKNIYTFEGNMMEGCGPQMCTQKWTWDWGMWCPNVAQLQPCPCPVLLCQDVCQRFNLPAGASIHSISSSSTLIFKIITRRWREDDRPDQTRHGPIYSKMVTDSRLVQDT